MRSPNEFETEINSALKCCDFRTAETLAEEFIKNASDEPGKESLATSIWFRSRYIAAYVLEASGKLTAAQGYIASLLPRINDLPMKLAWRILLLAAEINVRLHHLIEARQYLNRLQKMKVDYTQNPILKCRELRVRLLLGEITTLNDELNTCYQLLQDDADDHVLLLCEEGRAWDLQGDLNRAERCWADAFKLAPRCNRDMVRAELSLQMGRLQHLQGHLQASLNSYDSAQEYTVSGSPQLMEIRLRRLLLELDLNQEEAVKTNFQRWFGSIEPNRIPEELRGLMAMVAVLLGKQIIGSHSFEVRAFQAASAGDRQTATKLYKRAFANTKTPVRQARIALALGLLGLGCQDKHEIIHWLKLAEELAREHDLPEVLWRVLEAQGRVASEIEGDDQQARRLFEEAFFHSEQQRMSLTQVRHSVAFDQSRTATRQLLHGACHRGDAASVFHYQELDRGRLLLELWHLAAHRRSRIRSGTASKIKLIDDQIKDLRKYLESVRKSLVEVQIRQLAELELERERLLDQLLTDAGHRDDINLPEIPHLEHLQQILSTNTVYVAPSLFEGELYLLVAGRYEPAKIIHIPDSKISMTNQVEKFRRCVENQLSRYGPDYPHSGDRHELDARLEELGEGPLGMAINQVLDQISSKVQRLIWVPDGDFHGLPVHAIRLGGHYLIESHEIVHIFSGAWLVHHAKKRKRSRNGSPLILAESRQLRWAEEEGRGIAGTFHNSHILREDDATRERVKLYLKNASIVHLAGHAYFDAQNPIKSRIQLPSGEEWHAVEWLDEPLMDLPLLTLSGCRSANVAPLIGREVFGLVTGALAAGVQCVLAGLWSVPDREAVNFMWRFYRYRMTNDPATAIALTQRETLAEENSTPLDWAVFAVFGDPSALPSPPWWRLWWIKWRQSHHARKFSHPYASRNMPDSWVHVRDCSLSRLFEVGISANGGMARAFD